MRILTMAAAGLLTASVLLAQDAVTNPTGKAGTIGFMHAIHSTNDIDQTFAFYRAVFGLTGQVRPFQGTGPQLLTDSPGATLRVAMTPLRGAFNFELTEFGNIPRQLRQRPAVADPGAPMIQILVRDLDAVVKGAKEAGAPIVTTGGAPVQVSTPFGQTRAVLMRDPDGYFVQAIQAIAAGGDTDDMVLGATLGLTVRDMDETLHYWNDLLSIGLTADPSFSADPAVLDLLGLPRGASYRLARGVVPGSSARVELMEVRGVPRKDFDLRVTDANASGMAIRVARIGDVLAGIRAAGGRVLSRNGELVEWSATVRNVFVKDPNGFNIELVGSADPDQ